MPPKTCNDVLDESALFEGLERLILEKPGALKDAVAAYTKSRRSQAPDEDSLDKHREVWDVLVPHAPKGLPSFAPLQRVISNLAEQHDWGMSNVALRDMADKLKLMARHARDLARQGRVRNKCCASAALRAIVDRVDLGPGYQGRN